MRSPAFAAVAIAALALGLGANVAIFSVVDAVLVRPLPYPDPERLVRVGSLHPVKNADGIGASYPDWLDWRERSRSFDRLGAVLSSTAVLGLGGGEPVSADIGWVSADLLPALGIEPLAGRLFRPDEDRPGGSTRVLLLSKSLWTSRFGGDRSVIGRTLPLDGSPYVVVGVVPDESLVIGASVLAPIVNQAFPNRSGRALDVVGRLRPGVSLAAARSEMTSIGRVLESQYPEADRGFSVAVAPLHESLAGGRRRPLAVLFAAVGLLLLIACANIANLLLARGAARRRELAVRAALGASRGRLVRQLLGESTLLAFAGGAAGLAAASGLLSLIHRIAGDSMPLVAAASLDVRAAAFAFGASLATAILFGLLPAVSASRGATSGALHGAGRQVGHGRTRALDTLVLVQTALCLVLLATAGLLATSYVRLSRTDPGFVPDRIVSADLALPTASYRELPRRAALAGRVLERLRALPGVQSAAITRDLPGGRCMTVSFSPEGHPRVSRAESPQAEIRPASGSFFETFGIPILAGRGILDSDDASSAPVIVVNRRLAARLWPGRSALGMHVTLFSDGLERRVVGVAGDVRRLDRGGEAPEAMFVPYAQDLLFNRIAVAVRGEAGGAPLSRAVVERAVREIDPAVAVSGARTMREVLAARVAEPRLRTILVGSFAAAAVLLAALGLYGVIAYGVARRRAEIGVRMAFGATPGEVRRHVVGGGLRLACSGIAVGLVAALATSRLLSGLLYGVTPADPLVHAGSAGFLLAVAAAASLIPAFRASRTDPVVALRSE